METGCPGRCAGAASQMGGEFNVPRLSDNHPTPEQLESLVTFTANLGEDAIKRCFRRHCGNGNYSAMTKNQAKRLLIELGRIVRYGQRGGQ